MQLLKKISISVLTLFCTVLLLNSCSNYKKTDKRQNYEDQAVQAFYNFLDEQIEKYAQKPLLDIKEIDIINVNFSNEKVKFGGTSYVEEVCYDGYYDITFKLTSDYYNYGKYTSIYPDCDLINIIKNINSIHDINIYYYYNENKEMEFNVESFWWFYDLHGEAGIQNKDIIGE